MMKRAYSLLTVKSVDEDKREIVGVATTPEVDSYGDIVEPKGAEFKLPLPFLWQHNTSQPIGHVKKAKVTNDGIEVTISLVKTEEPGTLKDRLDEAWQSIKLGLVRGLSIGFKSIEHNYIEGTYGIHFIKWLWLELSAVTIPANGEATIQAIKSIDTKLLAASGREQHRVVSLLPKEAGVSARSVTNSGREANGMNIQESIQRFEAKRAASTERMKAIMEAADKEGRTLNEAEADEHDTLTQEVKSVDEHLVRLRQSEAFAAAQAKKIVAPAADADAAAEAARARSPHITVVEKKLPPGVEFARYAMCLGSSKGNLPQALEIAKARFADTPRLAVVLKAAVAAGTTVDATWAGPLLEYNQFAGDFVEFLRPQTILGKFGQGGIPSLRAVPFNINIRGQTSGGSGYWVGQGAPKPLTKFDFENTYLGYSKVANIAVLTEELLRFSSPSAELLVRDGLAKALIERLDTDFVDPAKALVANVSPASITNGVVTIPASGTGTAANIRTDVKAAMSAYINANITPSSAVWIMPATVALALSLMMNPLGQPEFPGVSMNGGTFGGIPVIVSEYVPTVSAGALIILVNAQDVWLADDGQVVLSASTEASLQMLDNPTDNSATATPTTMVSMFQTDSVALKAERYINWKKRRAQAVQVIEDANWGD